MLDMDGKWALTAVTSISLLLSTLGLYGVSRMQSGPLVQILQESTLGPIVREAALFAFMAGIPFVALITGAARIDLMALGADLSNPNPIGGFTFANWARAAGIGVVICACVLTVLVIAARASNAENTKPAGLLAIRDAIYDEVHWTFYRAAPALLLNDVYAGVMIGAGLILVEWLARPGKHFADSFTGNRPALVLRLACLLASAFLYLATQNLYVMIVVHCVVMLAGSRLMRQTTTAPSTDSANTPAQVTYRK